MYTLQDYYKKNHLREIAILKGLVERNPKMWTLQDYYAQNYEQDLFVIEMVAQMNKTDKKKKK